MVPVSSSDPSFIAGDRALGFEIYFQGHGSDRQPDGVDNSSSSGQTNQSLDFTTPEIRSDQGAQASTQHLPSQRINSRFSANVNPTQNAENFWIRPENSDQLLSSIAHGLRFPPRLIHKDNVCSVNGTEPGIFAIVFQFLGCHCIVKFVLPKVIQFRCSPVLADNSTIQVQNFL